MDSPTLNERVPRLTCTPEGAPPRLRQPFPAEGNEAAADQRSTPCVHELFEEQARLRPQATAVSQGESKLTYGALNGAANRLARHLRDLGVERDVPVGILMQRRIEMIVALLATLKAGGAYVPLDPTCPRSRLAEMMSGAEPKIVLTTRELVDRLPGGPARALAVEDMRAKISSLSAENLPRPPSPGLAYVAFTAGSAGKPKATGVDHRGWTNLVTWLARKFAVSADDRVLVTGSFSLDATQRSIAMPLVAGGQLHLLTADVDDPEFIARSIADQRITLLNCAPGAFHPVVETSARAGNSWPSLKTVFLGGESISASRVREWAQAPTIAVANFYGAAEGSQASTFYRLLEGERSLKTPASPGLPTAKAHVHGLDEQPRPAPFERREEIRIAGDRIAAGPINDNQPGAPPGRPAASTAETPLACDICLIFAEALALDGVGKDDDFFDLGGDSLKAVAVVDALAKRLGRIVPVQALFETRTARKLCRRIEMIPYWKSR